MLAMTCCVPEVSSRTKKTLLSIQGVATPLNRAIWSLVKGLEQAW